MTSDEMKEAVDLLAEYAWSKMLILDTRQQDLLRRYAEAISKV